MKGTQRQTHNEQPTANADGSIEELFDNWDGYEGDHDTDWEEMESAGNENLDDIEIETETKK